jgi:hypothetical protein
MSPQTISKLFSSAEGAPELENVWGGLVFGESSTKNGFVQFTRQAAYWLSTEELSRKVLIRSNTGQAV